VDAQRPIVLSTLNLNRQNLVARSQVTNNASLWIPHIKPGTYFERNGVIVEVITVEGDSIVAIEEDTNEEILLSLNQAAELLKAYIG
jgi:hypothetical protein